VAGDGRGQLLVVEAEVRVGVERDAVAAFEEAHPLVAGLEGVVQADHGAVALADAGCSADEIVGFEVAGTDTKNAVRIFCIVSTGRRKGGKKKTH
jgi:hypothetical protein